MIHLTYMYVLSVRKVLSRDPRPLIRKFAIQSPRLAQGTSLRCASIWRRVTMASQPPRIFSWDFCDSDAFWPSHGELQNINKFEESHISPSSGPMRRCRFDVFGLRRQGGRLDRTLRRLPDSSSLARRAQHDEL